MSKSFIIEKGTYSVFALFLTIYFLLPFINCFFWREQYSEIYRLPDSLIYALVIPVIIIIILFGDIVIPKIKWNPLTLLSFFFSNRLVVLSISVLFFVSAFKFSQSYDLSYRQHNALSDSGLLTIALFALRSYFKVYIFYIILYDFIGCRITRFHKGILSIVIMSYILSMTASLDAVYILVSSKYLLPKFFIIRETQYKGKRNIKTLIVNLIAILGIVVVLSGTVFIGLANKVGTEKALERVTNKENLQDLYIMLSQRVSTHYVSTLTSGEMFFENPFFANDAIKGTLINLSNRFLILTGEKANNRPKVWSINRLNFTMLFRNNINPRTGATPGLFAMAYYIPYFPLSIFFVSVYTLMILRKVSRILVFRKKKISLFMKFILVFFMLPLFDNPIAILNLLDPSTLYLVFFFIAIAALSKKVNRQYEFE